MEEVTNAYRTVLHYERCDGFGLDCIHLAQDRDQRRALVNKVMKLVSIKRRILLLAKQTLHFSETTPLYGVGLGQNPATPRPAAAEDLVHCCSDVCSSQTMPSLLHASARPLSRNHCGSSRQTLLSTRSHQARCTSLALPPLPQAFHIPLPLQRGGRSAIHPEHIVALTHTARACRLHPPPTRLQPKQSYTAWLVGLTFFYPLRDQSSKTPSPHAHPRVAQYLSAATTAQPTPLVKGCTITMATCRHTDLSRIFIRSSDHR